MIYPEQRADYLSKSWTASEFDAQFNILMDEEAFIGINEEGFVRLNFLEKMGQIIKGLLGGTDYSQRYRVQAVWLKFLYYGEAQGFLTEDHIKNLGRRMSYPYAEFDPAIQNLFDELKNHHEMPIELETDHLNNLREIVSEYHSRRSTFLQPGFWRRLITPPSLDVKKLVFFGDTPLQLSQKALNQQPSNPLLALVYLKKAFDLKNSSSDFQEKLATQLQELEDSYLFELEGQERKIQELWIQLGATALENAFTDQAEFCLSRALKSDSKNVKAQHEVGKLYLTYQEYDLAKPFLEELQKVFPNHLQIQMKVGHAYWEADQFQEAAKAYATALNCYQKNVENLNVDHKQIAHVYHRIGQIHLKQLIPTANMSEAVAFLSSAVKMDPTVLKYQENLWETYVQLWHASNADFVATYEQKWFKFLDTFDPSLVKKNKTELLAILLECGEQHFKAHHNPQAHTCLEKALRLFKNNVDIKIKALDLAIRYSDWSPFKPKFEAWMKEHYAHPYLLGKIGDAYWNSHNKSEALKLYQRSVDLFDQCHSVCEDDTERKSIEQLMADIQARMGQSHLQAKPGIFTAILYDEAILQLEKATALNAGRYSSALFDAYIAAAQAEKQRTFLLRDTNKIIAYLQKAFHTSPKKGDYVIELMQLYLNQKLYDEAVEFYYDTQKCSWAKEITFPSVVYSELGKKLLEYKDYESALDCFKQAYTCDVKNQKYKQQYFQLALKSVEQDYEAIATENAEENEPTERLLKMASNLEVCWQEGFDKIEKLKPSFQKTLTQIYGSLAHYYVQRCWLPRPEKEMEKTELREHRQIHEEDIQKALNYYDNALNYYPENAALHFDKGVLLDWAVEFEKALKEFELAVLHEPRNPFYHRCLAPLYFAVHVNDAKKEEHLELTKKYASPDFSKDFQIWQNEVMSQEKSKHIDPHTYTQKKGFFD